MELSIDFVSAFKGEHERLDSLMKRHSYLIDYNVKWIVVDGSDHAISGYLPSYVDYVHVRGCGLYQAINIGITRVIASHYIVIGDDDELYEGGLREVMNSLRNSDTINTFVVDGVVPRLKRRRYPTSHLSYVYQHAVSSVIPKRLHMMYGLYREDLKIASDAFFLLTVAKDSCKIISIESSPIGKYGNNGISSTNRILAYNEMSKLTKELGFYASSLYYSLKVIFVYLEKKGKRLTFKFTEDQ